MARLGFRTMDEMIGRVDRLKVKPAVDHWKTRGHRSLADPGGARRRRRRAPRRRVQAQDHGLDRALDNELISRCQDALNQGQPVELHLPIRNVHRTVGTMLGSEITQTVRQRRAARRSDYGEFHRIGGAELRRVPAEGRHAAARRRRQRRLGQGPVGRQARGAAAARRRPLRRKRTSSSATSSLYGATSGEAYVCGVAGERFAVRNSGAHGGGRRRRRSRLRVHDRRAGRRPRPDRAGTSRPA